MIDKTPEHQGTEPAPETPAGKASLHPVLKLVLEFGPLVAFFLSYRVYSGVEQPLLPATAVFMVAMTLSVAISWLLTRSVAVMPVVTLVIVLIFGGLTLWLNDATFIKMKPTIINSLFAAILLGGLKFNRIFLELLFGEAFDLNEKGWRLLTIRWGLFFVFLALLNEVVWRNFSESFWVSFKVWGNFPLTLAFAAFQMKLINRYTL